MCEGGGGDTKESRRDLGRSDVDEVEVREVWEDAIDQWLGLRVKRIQVREWWVCDEGETSKVDRLGQNAGGERSVGQTFVVELENAKHGYRVGDHRDEHAVGYVALRLIVGENREGRGDSVGLRGMVGV